MQFEAGSLEFKLQLAVLIKNRSLKAEL